MSTDDKDNLDLGTQVPQSGENSSRQTNLSGQDSHERNEENSRTSDDKKDSNGDREQKSRTFNENEESWQNKKQEGTTANNAENAGSGAGYGHNGDDEAFDSDRKI